MSAWLANTALEKRKYEKETKKENAKAAGMQRAYQ